jgi:hypothetical protein
MESLLHILQGLAAWSPSEKKALPDCALPADDPVAKHVGRNAARAHVGRCGQGAFGVFNPIYVAAT